MLGLELGLTELCEGSRFVEMEEYVPGTGSGSGSRVLCGWEGGREEGEEVPCAFVGV